MQKIGYYGLILEYAKEILEDGEVGGEESIAVWREGLLETVGMTQEGDFIGLKCVYLTITCDVEVMMIPRVG